MIIHFCSHGDPSVGIGGHNGMLSIDTLKESDFDDLEIVRTEFREFIDPFLDDKCTVRFESEPEF